MAQSSLLVDSVSIHCRSIHRFSTPLNGFSTLIRYSFALDRAWRICFIECQTFQWSETLVTQVTVSETVEARSNLNCTSHYPSSIKLWWSILVVDVPPYIPCQWKVLTCKLSAWHSVESSCNLGSPCPSPVHRKCPFIQEEHSDQNATHSANITWSCT